MDAPADASRVLRSFLTAGDVAVLVGEVIPSIAKSEWLPGRQATGYFKWPLRDPVPSVLDELLDRSKRALGCRIIDWDCYVLRYPDGTAIAPHTDPTDEHRHARLNAVVSADGGGVLSLAGQVVPLQVGDAVVFRPDMVEHAVTPVDGERYVWSVGCVF